MAKAIMIRVLAAAICAQLCVIFTFRAWGASSDFLLEGAPVMGPPFGAQSLPSIASNETDVFVAWQEQGDNNQHFQHSIRGVRIGADGSISSPAGIIFDPAMGPRTPYVFSNRRDYLIVWTVFERTYVRRVSFGSDVAQEQVLTLPTGDAALAGVASNGHDYVLVWRQTRVSSLPPVLAAVVREENGVLTGSLFPVPVPEPPFETMSLSLASNGENYLLSFHETDFEDGSSGTRTSGVILDGANPASNSGWRVFHQGGRTNDSSINFSRSVAAANGDYILVFRAGVDELLTLPVRRDGSAGPMTSLPIEGLRATGSPEVVRAEDRQFLLWQTVTGRNTALTMLELDNGGLPAGQPRPVALPPNVVAQQISLAILGETLWVAWTSEEPGTGYDVNVSRFTLDGQAAGPALQPAKVANSQTHPAVASNGSEYLAVWVDDRNRLSSGYDLYGARVDRNGNLLDVSAFPIATAPGYQGSPSVCAAGTNFVISWVDERRGLDQSDIYVARVTALGQVLEPQGICVSSNSFRNFSPSIASNGDVSLVVWEQRSFSDNSASDVRAVRISASGAVLDPEGIQFTGARGEPAVASDGTNFLVVFHSALQIASARVSPDGVVLDSPPKVHSLPASSSALRAAFNGSDYIVSFARFRQEQGFWSDIHALFVGADGNFRFAAPAPLLVNTPNNVQLAAYGKDYETGVTAFAPDGYDGFRLDTPPLVPVIPGLLESDGAVTRFVPAGEMEQYTPTALAYGGEGNFLLVKTSFASGYQRLLGRLVSTFQPVSIKEGKTQVRWKAAPGKTYQIDAASDLSNPVWVPLETRAASRSIESVEDASDATGTAQKYYRISERP